MESPSHPHSPAPPEAFYLPRGADTYLATEAAQGPWDPRLQHGGPPAALLAHAAEEQAGRPELRVTRVSVDFLGPIPVGEVAVRVKVVRPGRRVQLVEAELLHQDRAAAVARIWQHAASAGARGPATTWADEPPRVPDPEPAAADGTGGGGLTVLGGFGYGRALDWRTTSGSADLPGPSAVWTRMRVPLVAGRETSGLERLLVTADSANGASLELPLDTWLSMPTSLNVTLLRHPEGEWVHLDARTHLGGDGAGMTEARMADTRGWLGIVAQPLLITRRE